MKFRTICTSAALTLAAVNVNAATVLDITDGFSANGIKNYSFQITAPGSYEATLTDYNFPDTFTSLALSINKAPTILGSITHAGSFTFNAATTGTYTALVFGKPGTTTGFSSFGLTVAAVPEPETYAMMLAGLGLVGVIARRRKTSMAATLA